MLWTARSIQSPIKSIEIWNFRIDVCACGVENSVNSVLWQWQSHSSLIRSSLISKLHVWARWGYSLSFGAEEFQFYRTTQFNSKDGSSWGWWVGDIFTLDVMRWINTKIFGGWDDRRWIWTRKLLKIVIWSILICWAVEVRTNIGWSIFVLKWCNFDRTKPKTTRMLQ